MICLGDIRVNTLYKGDKDDDDNNNDNNNNNNNNKYNPTYLLSGLSLPLPKQQSNLFQQQ